MSDRPSSPESPEKGLNVANNEDVACLEVWRALNVDERVWLIASPSSRNSGVYAVLLSEDGEETRGSNRCLKAAVTEAIEKAGF